VYLWFQSQILRQFEDEFEFEFEERLVVVLEWHITDIKGEARG
jgi:hypothetical protein